MVVEHLIKKGKGSCFGDNGTVSGTIILSNVRIYLEINEDEKMNEILLKDIDKISIGGINVLRCNLKNGHRYNFLVSNIFTWLNAIKKAMKK